MIGNVYNPTASFLKLTPSLVELLKSPSLSASSTSVALPNLNSKQLHLRRYRTKVDTAILQKVVGFVVAYNVWKERKEKEEKEEDRRLDVEESSIEKELLGGSDEARRKKKEIRKIRKEREKEKQKERKRKKPLELCPQIDMFFEKLKSTAKVDEEINKENEKVNKSPLSFRQKSFLGVVRLKKLIFFFFFFFRIRINYFYFLI
jgi:hypothetical protein